MRIDPLWCTFVNDSRLVPPRVAFAIGRATGSAVQRNRLRRRLREILRVRELPPGLDLIGAHARACEHPFAELSDSVDRLIPSIRSRTEMTATP